MCWVAWLSLAFLARNPFEKKTQFTRHVRWAWIEEPFEAQAFGQGYQLPGKSIIARLVTGAKPKGTRLRKAET